MTETNKTVVRSYIQQVWNAHLVERLEEFVATDVVAHDALGVTDLNSLKKSVAEFLAAFPDLKIALDAVLADGDHVVIRETIGGTQQGELPGMPTTGKHAVWTGIGIFRLTDEKIVEIWGVSDTISMLQQLGLMLPPAPAAG